jgi:peptidoglycan/xylan/chitin deacetylase (PgdA/CDA1 family)
MVNLITSPNWILILLTAVVFGISGCRMSLSPTPLPTPPARSAEILPSPTPAIPPTIPAEPTSLSPQASPDLTRPPALPTLITHGDRSRPYIALTFDACQTTGQPTGYDETVINILTETNTPATLFLSGLWIRRHPNQTQALAMNPLFELGNHAWSHPDFTQLTLEEMSAEIQRTQQIMQSFTGRQPTLFRFPFDTYTDEAVAVVGQHGLRVISGDVVSGDPDPNMTAQTLVDQVTTQAKNGSIVIMHMNTRGWRTAEALPIIIKQLHEDGYSFVTVSQLLQSGPVTPVP